MTNSHNNPSHSSPSWWAETRREVAPAHLQQAVQDVTQTLAGMSRNEARDRRHVSTRAKTELTSALREYGYAAVSVSDLEASIAQIVSQVAGLRLLDALIPPACDLYTDIQLNSDGSVWARAKGRIEHERLSDVHPQQEEVWQVIETLLAPEGKACS